MISYVTVKNLPRTYCDLQQTLDCTLAQMGLTCSLFLITTSPEISASRSLDSIRSSMHLPQLFLLICFECLFRVFFSEQYYSYYSDGNLTGCYCDVPCRETRYQVSQFTALFPSDVAIDNVVEAYNVTADYIRFAYNYNPPSAPKEPSCFSHVKEILDWVFIWLSLKE